MRIGYLECFAGISGDMLLGALVDAGVPLSHLDQAAAGLNVGARLEARKVMRGGLTATKIDVITGERASSETAAHSHSHEHTHTHTHAHEHGLVHSHAHSHTHLHDHAHEEGNEAVAQSHVHEQYHETADSHPHAHEHDLVHSHAHSHTHTHDHAHEEGKEAVAHSHVHEHDHETADSHPHDHTHATGEQVAAVSSQPPDSGNEHQHPDAPGSGGHAHHHAHGHDEGHEHHHHRSLSTILGIIERAQLPATVKVRASRAFRLLGEAEAAIHSIAVETVHFHEVGAVDTIVDIVCSAVGAEWLQVDRWMASPLNVGSGTVDCAHGTLPVPAPATLALLGNAPVYAAGPAMERVTPTGATVLRMLDVRYGTLPAMRVNKNGYGAGGRDTPGQPNVLRLLVGDESSEETGTEPIAILETVIDDSTAQVLAYVSELLLAAGAWDVYRVPVQMKKGRTGTQMTVLSSPELLPALRDLLFRETTTIGLHWRVENKIALKRGFEEVETAWGPVRIKVARWASGEVANATPEYEDCRKLAAAHGLPLKQVLQEAARLYAAKKEAQG